MKLQIVLISITALLFVSCGKSNENEYAISRLADMITLYWVLPADSEIANFEFKDNVLELDIGTGKHHEKRQLSIPIGAWQQKSFAIMENHETLEIKGISRLDDLAIFHIMVHPTVESTSEFPFKTHIMWKSIDGKWQESPQIVPSVCVYTSSRPDSYLRNIGGSGKPGSFRHAKIFRSGDRITAYWHSSGKPRTWFNQVQSGSGYIGGGVSEKAIGLPNDWIQQMSITKIEPHEDITCLGVGTTPEIFIAYFRISSNSTN